jgi:transketolase
VPPVKDLEERCINALRMLSVDTVQHANSGHPGLPMGAATMAYVLWTRHLRHNPANPLWPDRDRFVLSAGHASALLYSPLFLTGYDRSVGCARARSRCVARLARGDVSGRREKRGR